MEAIEALSQFSDSVPLMLDLLAGDDVDERKTALLERERSFHHVVALGYTGAGKSAVLNSLIGHAVLPTGEGGATHAPTHVHLTRNGLLSNQTISWTITSGSGSDSDCPWTLRESIKDMWSTGNWLGVKIKLITSTAPPLKLVDLPGVEKGNLDVYSKVYIERSDAILLVVIPAGQAPDVLSAKAFQMAKEFDQECTRTVGVITKIDQASTNPEVIAAVQALLLNQGPRSTSEIPWVAVLESVTLKAATLVGYDEAYEFRVAWQAENESLSCILEGVPSSKLGRSALVETIAQQIRHRMKVRLTDVLYSGRLSRRSRPLRTWVVVLVLLVILGAGFSLFMGYESIISSGFLFVAFCCSLVKQFHSTGVMLKDLWDVKATVGDIKATFWKKR